VTFTDALRHADAELVLIDRRNHHNFRPLLYQVATAVLSPAEIAAPIHQLEVKQRNLCVFLAEVTDVGVASRTTVLIWERKDPRLFAGPVRRTAPRRPSW
jgi:NADH dehydrogenase